jgi:hypothetical protein
VDIGAFELQPSTITSVTSTTANGFYGIGATINVTINFSAPVTLTGGPLTVNLDDGGTVVFIPGASTSGQMSFSGTYTVAPGQNTNDLDSVSLTLAPGAILDAVPSLAIPAGQSLKDSKALVIDTIDPTIAISPPSATNASTGPVTYTVTYSDLHFASSTLSTADITLNKTGSANGTVTVTGSGTTRTVTISNITGDGSLSISIAANTATDLAGNKAPAAGPSDEITVRNSSLLAVGGSDGSVRILNAKNGQTLTTFRPLDIPGVSRYTGIVEVALGDLNKDGIPEVFVAAANPVKTDGLALTKASRVFVYDGAALLTGTVPAPFRTFTPFKNHFGPGPNGTVDQAGDYVNGVNIALGDVNGDGTLDLIAGTRGGVLANGGPEFGRLVVLDGSAPSGDVTIGSIVTPFGLGYQKGVVVSAGDLDADGKAEIAVTRGGPVAAVNPHKDLTLKVFKYANGSLNELALSGNIDSPLTPFAGITGANGNVLARDARVSIVDTAGNGKGQVVISILDPYSTPGNTQVRIAAFSVNTTSGLATVASTGSGPSGSYTVGTAVVDHAITHIDPNLDGLSSLALITESAASGVQYLNPLNGTGVPGGFALNVAHGGVSIDGF